MHLRRSSDSLRSLTVFGCGEPVQRGQLSKVGGGEAEAHRTKKLYVCTVSCMVVVGMLLNLRLVPAARSTSKLRRGDIALEIKYLDIGRDRKHNAPDRAHSRFTCAREAIHTRFTRIGLPFKGRRDWVRSALQSIFCRTFWPSSLVSPT